jgi:hypothetical protein
VPKENQVAKPFLTSKQDKKSHGVPDDPEFDAGNFEFAPDACNLSNPQPSSLTSSQCQFAAPTQI